MKPGKLKEIHTRRAFQKLESKYTEPRLTTTQALCVLKAGCGPVKFHRILEKHGYATKINEYQNSGYEFSLPNEFGSPTYTIDNHSFQWKPMGIKFIAHILEEEGIAYEVPNELLRWIT